MSRALRDLDVVSMLSVFVYDAPSIQDGHASEGDCHIADRLEAVRKAIAKFERVWDSVSGENGSE